MLIKKKKNLNKKINCFLKQNNRQINSLRQKELIALTKILDCLRKLDLRLEMFKKNSKDNEKKQKILKRDLDLFFKRANVFELSVTNSLFVKKFKVLFREIIKKYVSKSCFLRHGLLKPAGYPGDFFIMEAMYDNVARSHGIGRLFDEYFLRNPYVRAVRARKNTMRSFLRSFLYNNLRANVKILNLACGACREIRELFTENAPRINGVEFFFVDQDVQSLNYAKQKLSRLVDISAFHFVHSDVIDFLKHRTKKTSFLKYFDLIYSIGLADYLPDSILGLMLKYSCLRLKSGGIFLVAFKNTKVFTSTVSDWGADWNFIARSPADIKSLALKFLPTPSYCVNFTHDKYTKRIFWMAIKKK